MTAAATGAGTLLDRVLAASTRDIAGPDGRVFEVDVDRDARGGEAAVTYRLGQTVLGVRRLRVDERSRVVSLLGFDLPTWWYDGTSAHEQFVENLTALGGPACLLTGVVSQPRSWVWAPHFAWAHGMDNANAAAVAGAVEAITPAPGQSVWGGSDLPAQVQLIAGPDPRREDGQGSWRHLVETTTPAQLVAALDALHDGLAQVVFTHLPAWYGERAVGLDAG